MGLVRGAGVIALGGSLVMCGGPSFVAGDAGGESGASSGVGVDGSSGGANPDGSSGSSTSSSSGSSSGSSGSSSSSGSSTSSSGSGAGEAGPWSPAMLPGLVVWLDDTKGVVQSTTVSGAVARWLDQSGTGNDATPVNTQGAAGFNFTIDPAVVNGHDAIVCPGNGTYLQISDGSTVEFGTGDFGIVAVAKFAAPEYVWEKVDPNGGGPGLALGFQSGNYQLSSEPGANVVLAAAHLDAFHIVAGRGAQFYLAADGLTATGPASTSDLSYPNGHVALCFQSGASPTGATNELAELIVVKGTLSDADLARTVAYLGVKFKL